MVIGTIQQKKMIPNDNFEWNTQIDTAIQKLEKLVVFIEKRWPKLSHYVI